MYLVLIFFWINSLSLWVHLQGFQPQLTLFLIYFNIFHIILAFITIHLAFQIFRIDVFKSSAYLWCGRANSIPNYSNLTPIFFAPLPNLTEKTIRNPKKRSIEVENPVYFSYWYIIRISPSFRVSIYSTEVKLISL